MADVVFNIVGEDNFSPAAKAATQAIVALGSSADRLSRHNLRLLQEEVSKSRKEFLDHLNTNKATGDSIDRLLRQQRRAERNFVSTAKAVEGASGEMRVFDRETLELTEEFKNLDNTLDSGLNILERLQRALDGTGDSMRRTARLANELRGDFLDAATDQGNLATGAAAAVTQLGRLRRIMGRSISFLANYSENMAKLNKRLTTTGKLLTSTATGFRKLASPIGLASVALAKLTKDGFDFAGQAQEISKWLGISAEDASALARAYDNANLSQDRLRSDGAALLSVVQDLRTGSDTYRGALDRLGIEVDSFIKLEFNDQMDKITTAIRDSKLPTSQLKSEVEGLGLAYEGLPDVDIDPNDSIDGAAASAQRLADGFSNITTWIDNSIDSLGELVRDFGIFAAGGAADLLFGRQPQYPRIPTPERQAEIDARETRVETYLTTTRNQGINLGQRTDLLEDYLDSVGLDGEKIRAAADEAAFELTKAGEAGVSYFEKFDELFQQYAAAALREIGIIVSRTEPGVEPGGPGADAYIREPGTASSTIYGPAEEFYRRTGQAVQGSHGGIAARGGISYWDMFLGFQRAPLDDGDGGGFVSTRGEDAMDRLDVRMLETAFADALEANRFAEATDINERLNTELMEQAQQHETLGEILLAEFEAGEKIDANAEKIAGAIEDLEESAEQEWQKMLKELEDINKREQQAEDRARGGLHSAILGFDDPTDPNDPADQYRRTLEALDRQREISLANTLLGPEEGRASAQAAIDAEYNTQVQVAQQVAGRLLGFAGSSIPGGLFGTGPNAPQFTPVFTPEQAAASGGSSAPVYNVNNPVFEVPPGAVLTPEIVQQVFDAIQDALDQGQVRVR